MSVLDYLSNEEGVKANVLSPLRPMTTKQKLIKLHNILQNEFYTNDRRIAMEVTITIDPKKVNESAIDDIHALVKVLLPECNIVLVREFSPRVHYHGIILGNNTQIGKYNALIKRMFGRVSRVRHITYPRSYICYMLKDLWKEETMDWHRIVRNILLTDMMNNTDYQIDKELILYTDEEIERINSERTKK